MDIQKHIGKYMLGALAGVALVVGCGGGGGNGSVNSAGAASQVGVTSQLFCRGNSAVMAGLGGTMSCLSSVANATTQNFASFNAIAQQGWILVEMQSSGTAGGQTYLFNK